MMRVREIFQGRKIIIIAAILMLLINVAHAQHRGVHAHKGNQKDSTDYPKSQLDVTDVWREMKGQPTKTGTDSGNLKKGKIYLSFIPAIGYTVQTSFTAVATANISFYTDQPGHENISTIYGSANFSLLNQIIVPVITNIWTKGNEFNFLGDYRYYKYPSITYGLGGHTSAANPDPISFSYIRFYQVVAKEVLPDFLLGLGYNLDYRYNILDYGNSDHSQTDFNKYEGGNIRPVSISSGISANLIYDTRRNSNNPQDGWLANISFRPNLTYLGSDNNWQSLFTEFRKYIKIPGTSHNVLAFWNFNWFTFGHAPYLDLPATAWETYANSARGYIQDRFKGQNMMYFETEYRFQILDNGFLGGVVFANAQAVSNYPGNKFDAVYPAAGLGLRIKINKFSNTNACIDYGIGLQGSRAFYLNLGEVF